MMKKKWLVAAMSGMLMMGGLFAVDGAGVSAAPTPETSITIRVNGAVLVSDTQAFMLNGRVMVPLRTVSEGTGGEVKWNNASKSASATNSKHSFTVWAGKKTAVKDGVRVQLDTAPVMKQGRIYIPLRFSAEGLGGQVRWSNAHKTVDLYPGLTPVQAKKEVRAAADEVIKAIRDQDFKKLANLAHSKGVTFSPYAYVEKKSVTLSKEELAAGFANESSRLWGNYDGSGKPIQLSFKDYYKEFIYSSDFAKAPWVGYNESKSSGNTINNATLAFQGAVIVEYHFDGKDPQYGGIDWESLRLVFQKENGQWVLSGVIHDEWTV